MVGGVDGCFVITTTQRMESRVEVESDSIDTNRPGHSTSRALVLRPAVLLWCGPLSLTFVFFLPRNFWAV